MLEISIIIASYNMGEFISQAVDSVLHGSFQNCEVIVVDDGSTDRTNRIVQAYTDRSSRQYDSRVRYVRQSNKGKSAAVNQGLIRARGKFITILDADDQLTRNSLSLRYKALVDGGGETTQLAIGGFEVFDESGATIGHRPIPSVLDPESLFRRFYLAHKSPFHMNACLFSRLLCDRVGLFDTRLRRCQDIDFSLRLLKAVDGIAWIDGTVYRYRKHREDFIERLRVRVKTLIHRPSVYWKNYRGWRRYFGVFSGLALDAGKMAYEITGNYQS